MRMLRLWFYNPSAESSSMFNKMVAQLDPPFSHSELQFENEEASTIYHGGIARLKARTFDRQFYSCVSLPCSSIQYAKAYAFAQEAVSRSEPFSTFAMSNSFLGLPITVKGTFCSKLNADALCYSGVLHQIDTSRITPSCLHKIVTMSKEVAPVQQASTGNAPLDWSFDLHKSQQRFCV